MKKILIVHTKYQNIGGEDIAVENEVRFLEKYFDVKSLYFTNKIENYFNDFSLFILNKNRKSMKKLENMIDSFKPDYVYVHNTWFKGSLGIYKVLLDRNIQAILKLHNFRYFCTKSYLLKNHLDGNTVCNACGIKFRKGKIFNKYFDDSYIKSFLAIRFGKKLVSLLKSRKFKILVLTDFHKKFITNLGVNKNIVFNMPNYIDFNYENLEDSKEDYILYAGRISKEKGLNELIESFKKANIPNLSLKIIGNGPILNDLKAKHQSTNIELLGEKTNKEVINYIKNSRAVVTATKLFEGQPTFLCEASLLGVPSIFPKSGGIEEFFPNNYDLSYNQFDYVDLVSKFELLENLDTIKKIGIENKDYIKKYLNKNLLIKEFEKILYE